MTQGLGIYSCIKWVCSYNLYVFMVWLLYLFCISYHIFELSTDCCMFVELTASIFCHLCKCLLDKNCFSSSLLVELVSVWINYFIVYSNSYMWFVILSLFLTFLVNLRLITLQYVAVVLMRQYWWLCQCQCLKRYVVTDHKFIRFEYVYCNLNLKKPVKRMSCVRIMKKVIKFKCRR